MKNIVVHTSKFMAHASVRPINPLDNISDWTDVSKSYIPYNGIFNEIASELDTKDAYDPFDSNFVVRQAGILLYVYICGIEYVCTRIELYNINKIQL